LAPEGRHIMSITMQYAPYHLRDATWDQQRGALADAILGLLDEYVPDLRHRILHQHLITPLDWQQEYGLTDGGTYHGQMDLDQLLFMRPVPGWGRYRTPVDNLYLCGSGTHPGGGVTGAPGFNAAREVLRG
ncbi:MAG: amine oxidase, partial [Gemmatimonadota bacterium]